jgi:hypothetical protein
MNKYARCGLIATSAALLGIVAFQMVVAVQVVHELTKGVE